MNTKTDGISSGLVAAAKRCVHMHKLQVAQCGEEYTLIDGAGLEDAIADFEAIGRSASSGLVAVAWMMQSPDGQCMGFLPFTEEGTAPVVRLSDADEIISAKDAEINEQCRINGMGAERELHLLAQVAAKDAEIERLKAMLPDIPKRERECKSIEDWKARALYLESEYASCSHGFNSHAGKQSDRIKELEAFSRNAANGLLLREKQLAQQSAALKLAKDAFVGIANVEAGKVTTSYDMRRIALAAIDSLLK